MAVEIFKKNGPLAVLLNQRIMELKLVVTPVSVNSENFIIPILLFLQE